ncbi:MAG: tRNA (N(6)-L-threonylcarbamoyladenosine(37)-C(2))-methylthiotransferase MtaB [Muribaculaceae bacterium]|nr:tRNA (N(6)-L-threonylcarbamoyladenosine(37)-C(2))-methylthiotransferase MtaB [Muribaculaceae bacterium]
MIDNSTFGTRTALYHTFGCKLNFSETSTVAAMLAERGVRRATAGEEPDFIIVNSCSVTDLADKKCRQTIRSLHRQHPGAAIVVTGCYAQLKSDEVAALPGVQIVAGIDRKLDIADFVERWSNDHAPRTVVQPTRDIRTFSPSCSRGDRTRYFLKVQDGCDYWCSYCTIPAARGRSRSGTISGLVRQAEEAAAEGGKEIVITGVNIGDFGKGTDESFLDLCRALDKVDGIERYRISSIEPNLLTDDIIDFVAGSRSFMPHFHVPLQSGDDEVLSLMRRHYDTALFRRKMERIKQIMPHAFIGVDLIVGARGETEERFVKSRDFVASLPISRLHVFTYSERPGTRALEIQPSVSPEEKHRRTRIMLGVSDKLYSAFASEFEGDVRPVLLEHPKEGHMMGGFTDNYLRVELQASPSLDNHIVPVRLGRVDVAEEVFRNSQLFGEKTHWK